DPGGGDLLVGSVVPCIRGEGALRGIGSHGNNLIGLRGGSVAKLTGPQVARGNGDPGGWLSRALSPYNPAMNGVAAREVRKMNGLGNDFVVLDARARPVAISDARARAIADRRTGIGCDQLIVLEPSTAADVRMRIWNNEGFEVESCGNASRCIADILFAE